MVLEPACSFVRLAAACPTRRQSARLWETSREPFRHRDWSKQPRSASLPNRDFALAEIACQDEIVCTEGTADPGIVIQVRAVPHRAGEYTSESSGIHSNNSEKLLDHFDFGCLAVIWQALNKYSSIGLF